MSFYVRLKKAMKFSSVLNIGTQACVPITRWISICNSCVTLLRPTSTKKKILIRLENSFDQMSQFSNSNVREDDDFDRGLQDFSVNDIEQEKINLLNPESMLSYDESEPLMAKKMDDYHMKSKRSQPQSMLTAFVRVLLFSLGAICLTIAILLFAKSKSSSSSQNSFSLYSPVISDGTLPIDYTCLTSNENYVAENGAGMNNPSLKWINAPSNAVDFLLVLSTINSDTGDLEYLWSVFNIPITASKLPISVTEGYYGIYFGGNDDNYYYNAPCTQRFVATFVFYHRLMMCLQ